MSVGGRVAVAGTGKDVGSGRAVSVGEPDETAGAQEVKIRATSKTVLMFLTFMEPFVQRTIQQLALSSSFYPVALTEAVLSRFVFQ